ncbi:hypothetical protein [Reyranella sp.]|uniref:hypothetical protein n=1 Tax=Reyranella sp. TaxID=1929291 RepID=UPI003BACFAFF
MNIDRLPLWLLPLVVLVVLAPPALLLAKRRGWIRLPVTRREGIVLGKILFVVVSIMVMVMLRNAIVLPAGQFIYGRF